MVPFKKYHFKENFPLLESKSTRKVPFGTEDVKEKRENRFLYPLLKYPYKSRVFLCAKVSL